jgi:pimeloyl-ACP methyl ester carboxylesterase
MEIVEQGHGAPLVLIPGIQGRWEYTRPAVDALAAHFRVLTFSLCGERSSGLPFNALNGLDQFADQVTEALDAKGVNRAVVCGVSFGGLVALRFAALHAERTSALIMVSTPGPDWHLKPRHEMYTRLPWLFGPIFLAEAPARMRREIEAALPDRRERRRLLRMQLKTFATAPLSVTRLAARARLIGRYDRRADCAVIARPTLIVHGEPGLDHVVPADGSSAYASLIEGARVMQLNETGHLGSVTRPFEFAEAVLRFVESTRDHSHDTAA